MICDDGVAQFFTWRFIIMHWICSYPCNSVYVTVCFVSKSMHSLLDKFDSPANLCGPKLVLSQSHQKLFYSSPFQLKHSINTRRIPCDPYLSSRFKICDFTSFTYLYNKYLFLTFLLFNRIHSVLNSYPIP